MYVFKSKLLPIVSLIIVAVLLLNFYVALFSQKYIGFYPYLGERDLDIKVIDKIIEISKSFAISGSNLCNSTISVSDSDVYVICKFFKDRIEFPRLGGEKLKLSIYPQKISEFRKVWNKTITIMVNLPEDIHQGVYKIPNTNSYFFRISPGLPICLRISNPTGERVDIVVLIELNINNEKVVFKEVPGIIYHIGGVFKEEIECFDTVWAAFHNLARGNLEWDAYKPLMKLRGLVSITYVVEVYVDRMLLGKNLKIDMSIGPPYVVIRK